MRTNAGHAGRRAFADRCRRLARDSTDPVLQVQADYYQMCADELENDEIISAKRADPND
jgi:hypothetical protein